MSDFSKYINTTLALLFMGIVDQVHGQSAHVEITSSDGVSRPADLPLWIFPCDIKEGDAFYFTKADEALELRCGSPPE